MGKSFSNVAAFVRCVGDDQSVARVKLLAVFVAQQFPKLSVVEFGGFV